MIIGARLAMGGKDLPYDAEIEYLESTGSQWIDTGVYWNLGDTCKIVTAQSVVQDHCSFGIAGKVYAFSNNTANGLNLNTLHWGNAPYYGSKTSLPFAIGTDIHTINIGTNQCIIDGVAIGYSTSSFATGASLHTVVLFGRVANSATTSFNKRYLGRIYSFGYNRDGITLRDLIPVRFTNESGETEGAMYDRVTRALFRNAGTGAFVLGPDL